MEILREAVRKVESGKCVCAVFEACAAPEPLLGATGATGC
jgi:hypothetical protein